MFKKVWNKLKLNPTPPPPITWASLNTPEGRARWEAAERARPPFEMDPLQSMIDKYMNNTNVDRLIEWFRGASSQNPNKLIVATAVATALKPPGIPRVLDLPFIRFYLYKTLTTETGIQIPESKFNEILTIDKDKFNLRSGVVAFLGGDRTKHCPLILRIEDMLKQLGFLKSEYKISDQAKKCREQLYGNQELDDMGSIQRKNSGAEFDVDDDEYVLLPSATDENSGGRKKRKSHTKRYCKKRHTKKKNSKRRKQYR